MGSIKMNSDVLSPGKKQQRIICPIELLLQNRHKFGGLNP